MNLNERLQQIQDNLKGLIPHGDGYYLAGLAEGVGNTIVELGSFEGLSTAYLAAGARHGMGARVYAVDAWDLDGNVHGKHGFTDPTHREKFETQLRSVGLWSQVTPIQAFTTQAAEEWDHGPVDLLFVDADHAYESVKADVEAWLPHVEGLIVLDDLDTPRNPGVRQYFNQWAGEKEQAGERLGLLWTS